MVSRKTTELGFLDGQLFLVGIVLTSEVPNCTTCIVCTHAAIASVALELAATDFPWEAPCFRQFAVDSRSIQNVIQNPWQTIQNRVQFGRSGKPAANAAIPQGVRQ